ncbi:MAG: NADPH:quinone reductase [Pseudonocardiales bacterium]|jgi:NADPH2:quinone reductase|nr:NADPH:quinone reductase [Pseudonocardiales bacterium]
MRALILTELAGPRALRFTDADEPDPAGRVLVEVRAAGLIYPDLLMSYGRYQLKIPPPFVPGSEIAGVVVSAPEGSRFAPGQDVVGVSGTGGFAERVALQDSQLFPMSKHLDHAEAASMLVNHQTVHFAMVRRAGLRRGDTVLVLGPAGGVGSAAVAVAKALGARVIAVVHRAGAEDFLRGLGADEVVALTDGWAAQVRELTAGAGVDIVVDPVGGDAFDDAVRVLAPEGRLVVLGFAGGAIPQAKVNRLLMRNISVVGAGWGEFLRTHPTALAETVAALDGLVERGLRPPAPARYPLALGAVAMADLESGQILGKAVLVTDELVTDELVTDEMVTDELVTDRVTDNVG